MEWKKLSQLVERKICYGIVQPGKGKNGNIPVIKVNNIISGLKSITELDTTTHEIASKFQRTQLFGGEIVVSVVGSVGNTAIVPSSFKGCNLVRATAMVDIKDKVLATYVMYYFKTHEAQKYIESRLNTTVQATLNIKDLEEMPIPILQSSIILRLVSILSALDAKIENNNKINANLEAQAEALFKSWFVDFTPFKDQPFVDSELGPIPQGWKVGKLGDICTFKRGKNLLSKNAIDEGVPVVAGGLSPSCYHNQANTSAPVVTVSGSGANAGFMRMYHVDVWASDCSFIDVSCDYLYFVYCFLSVNRRLLKHAQTGAVQPHVKPADIHDFDVVIPEEDIVKAFQSIIKELLTKVGVNEKENQRLAALRDTLLPKLMSGEIKL